MLTEKRENKGWSIPELVGVAEAARILGLDGRSVSALERRRAAKASTETRGEARGEPRGANIGKRGGFPAPVQGLAMGPVWVRADIEEYKARRDAGEARPAPFGQARTPRALQSFGREQLERALRDPETGLSDREREVLRRRLGMTSASAPDGDPGGNVVRGETREGAGRFPASQQTIADELGVSLPTVKKAQERAVEKMLGALARFRDQPG